MFSLVSEVCGSRLCLFVCMCVCCTMRPRAMTIHGGWNDAACGSRSYLFLCDIAMERTVFNMRVRDVGVGLDECLVLAPPSRIGRAFITDKHNPPSQFNHGLQVRYL